MTRIGMAPTDKGEALNGLDLYFDCRSFRDRLDYRT
ncbi:hypothetical protein J2Y67_005133 [Neobacillus niacini]|nr:hypothetical protein [Neobacillus niacini]